jgi:aryl-alcohol dehydrogenase-like predicted oxidoreductase
VIATKLGHRVDAAAKNATAYGASKEDGDVVPRMRAELETSLSNLGTVHIDLYRLHPGGLAIARSLPVRDVLERFVAGAKIRAYGWSTDRTDATTAFSGGPGCVAVQQQLGAFDGNLELLALCEATGLASINRSPLGMGIRTGKFTAVIEFDDDDVRGSARWFPGLVNGRPAKEWIDALDSVRDVLTTDGRTLAQGAARLRGRSDGTIPIPGFKTRPRVRGNAGAMVFGPLTPVQTAEIDTILGRQSG